MDAPDISQLEAAARAVVYDARRHGRLDTLTPRMVRQTLESQFAFQDGTLDAKEFRSPLKSIIAAAATEDMPSPDVENATQQTKKRKAGEMLNPKPKKQNTNPPKSKKSSKEFKSAEMVPSSDVEDMSTPGVDDTSVELEKLPAMARSEDSAKENQAMPPSNIKKANPQKDRTVAKTSARPSTSAREATDKSDSELSILDESPKRAKKPKAIKSKDKGFDKSKSSKGKKTTELSKDEETIKRLKSLVLACGVRRIWAKVFKDVDSPSQQIRMLKQILSDLGMSGRMSLEQAKAIKEKRELAQELEDVQAFAASATRSKAVKPSEEGEEDEDESEEEELPQKRKTNAHRSIMAFLGDQSDDD
ncbi:hypothetical protein C8R44DRAFT_427027 [Mycena epipterygia]|nr:hypothetical protein C8R44DRAFT_427027 [Mycena epipterygia]